MKLTLRLFALAFATVLLSSCYAITKSENYYGINTVGQNVVFLLDTSGSMEGKDEGTIGGEISRQVVEQSAGVVQNAVGGFLGNLAGKQISSQATKLGAAM